MKVRNILFLVLASLLLCTAVSAAEYTDVSDTHWAYKQIDYLSAEITGYPDGSYKPEKSVSRAEFLTLFARIAFPDEWKRVEGEEWWKSAYEVCTAHDLLNNITGSRSEAMPRAKLPRFSNGSAPAGAACMNAQTLRNSMLSTGRSSAWSSRSGSRCFQMLRSIGAACSSVPIRGF